MCQSRNATFLGSLPSWLWHLVFLLSIDCYGMLAPAHCCTAGQTGPSSIRLPESLTLTALPSISPQTVTRHLHSPSLSQPLQSDWHISFNAPPCFYLLPRNLDGFLRGSWAREPAVFPAEISTSGEEEREPPPHPHFSRKSQEALIS